jgi:hypothetical protein
MLKHVALLSACILIVGAGAQAAELSKLGPGGELVGKPPSDLPAPLAPGDQVKGPATVTTAAGDVILLGKDAVLEVGAPDGGVETFSLLSGWAQGEIGAGTRIQTPAGTLEGPETGRTEFYMEKLTDDRSLFRVNKGTGKVVYENFSVEVPAGNAVELTRTPGKPGVLVFQTLPGNPGDVKLIAKVSPTLDIHLNAPRATKGRIEPWREGSHTKVSSDVGSWQGGKIGIETKPTTGGGKSGSLGAGTFAIINNVTGEIEFGFIEVDFAIIERAISLTSEFALLAVSNFFGLDDL